MQSDKGYTLTQKKQVGTTSDVYEINLTVPLFNRLLKTHAMSREFRVKSSIIDVPDTPFRLKLCFVGRKNELMEVYFISNSSIFLKSQLHLTLGGFSENFLTKDYVKVYANKWWYVSGLKDPGFRADVNNDILRLQFKFRVSGMGKHGSETPTPQLSDDFGILLTDGSYSDVTLKSVDGEPFNVHKNILATRSCVLKAHFEHDLKESRTNTVDTHFETEVLRDVLIFLYTDTAPRVDNDPGKLLAAADFYQIQGLKKVCGKALCKKLTVENAIETLQLAELHNVKNLSLKTLEFIKNEGANTIIATEGWKNNGSAELIKKIYEYLMSDVSSDILSVAYDQV